ncbi:YhbY family RNA-binding protein [Candidatus Woesearchaeota archaeon]|nr:YhbY family RNA-binding protein [Candidatus Woesearchaeota archaeon]
MITQERRESGQSINIPALRDEARNLESIIRIGKNGLTDSVIAEIVSQLKKKRLIKLKLLKAFLEGKDKKETAKEIAEKTKSVLVQQVGFVVVLYWPRKGD